MDHELGRRERAEARGHGDPLERQVRAVVAAMREPRAGRGKRAGDRSLGIEIERVGRGEQLRIGFARGDEARPQRARVADEQAPPGEPGDRGRAEIQLLGDIEAGIGEHAAMILVVRLHRDGAAASRADRERHARAVDDRAARHPRLGRELARHRAQGRRTPAREGAGARRSASPWTQRARHTAEHGRALAATLGSVTAIAGHSFGGKVALATRAFGCMRQTWMFDSSPGARPARAEDSSETDAQLIALMETLPRTWARRDDFVDAVVAAGQAKPLAQWLAMNVVPAGEGYALRLDLAAIREMIADYLAQDLWASAFDPALGDLALVIATRSG